LLEDTKGNRKSCSISWGSNGLCFDSFKVDNTFAKSSAPRFCGNLDQPASGWPTADHEAKVKQPFALAAVWAWCLRWNNEKTFKFGNYRQGD
jgi:hypothetical protein